MIVLFISVLEFWQAPNKICQPIVEHRWYHVVSAQESWSLPVLPARWRYER